MLNMVIVQKLKVNICQNAAWKSNLCDVHIITLLQLIFKLCHISSSEAASLYFIFSWRRINPQKWRPCVRQSSRLTALTIERHHIYVYVKENLYELNCTRLFNGVYLRGSRNIRQNLEPYKSFSSGVRTCRASRPSSSLLALSTAPCRSSLSWTCPASSCRTHHRCLPLD